MKPIVPVSARGERSPSGRDQTRLSGLKVMRGEKRRRLKRKENEEGDKSREKEEQGKEETVTEMKRKRGKDTRK